MGRRKDKAEQLQQQKERRRKYIIVGVSVSVFIIGLIVALIVILQPRQGSQTPAGRIATSSTIQLAPDSNGDLRVPLNRLQNRLQYIAYGGREELLLWRDSNGVIRTAFDTCEECYSRGNVRFTLSGNILTCSQCGVTQPVSVLGTEGWGGCRPVAVTPAMRNDTDTEVVVPAAVLAYARDMFSRWNASDFSISFAAYGTDRALISE